MGVVFESVKAGDVLYSVTTERAGNTSMRRVAVRKVYVKEVDHENKRALCSWNGNTPSWFYARQVRRWRRSPPKERAR